MKKGRKDQDAAASSPSQNTSNGNREKCTELRVLDAYHLTEDPSTGPIPLHVVKLHVNL